MNAARPNILWIVTTQWRAQACGYAGDPNARTPHLDALAAESINFTQAVTPHPFGPFARAAILTGVLSPENGLRGYFDPLPVGTRTIAHDLVARGYATAFFGKWHLGRRDPSEPLVGEAHAKIVVPTEERGGFEFWEGFESGFLINDPWLHGTRLPQPQRFVGYQSDVVCSRAAEWIAEKTRGQRSEVSGQKSEARRQKSEVRSRRLEAGGEKTKAGHQKPETGSQRVEHGKQDATKIENPNFKIQNWFAVVSLEPPHPPYDAPAPRSGSGNVSDISLRNPAEIILPANVPLGGEVEARARRELAGYYAHIEATDRAIGRLLATVPRDTAVVFTSVHGDMHGAQGLFRKGWPHEESVRVPLLMRWGGNAEWGMRNAECGSQKPEVRSQKPEAGTERPASRGQKSENREEKSDAAITLADLPALMLAKIQNPNFKFQNQSARISMPSVVRLPDQCDRIWRGVRTPRRKLVLNADASPWLFFDLENDPLEQRNLAGEAVRSAEMADLRALID